VHLVLQQAPKIGLIVVAVCFLAQGKFVAPDRAAFGCAGGMGAGCGGGIGYSGGGNSGGYGFGGYTGCGGYSGRGPVSTTAGFSFPARTEALRPVVKQPEQLPDSILLRVDVPADAKVFINDRPTTSTGARRVYASTGLKSAGIYPYRVRAEFVSDGKPVSLEKSVPLTAGKSASVTFEAPTELHVADLAPGARAP
jgi:uncharacterized protein (TIGR03000 family)